MKSKLESKASESKLYFEIQTTSEPVPSNVSWRTQKIREGLDGLDEPDRLGYRTGPEPLDDDLGRDDIDGDLIIDDSTEPDAPAPQWAGIEEHGDALPEHGGLPTLQDVIGSRNPAVVVRIERLNVDAVAARIVRPSAGAEEALELLGDLAQTTFNQARRRFDAGEWEQLLGAQPVSPLGRLALLARLHVDPEQQARAAQDHGLARYDKFVLLPDGTAFNIRFLFRDRRGKPSRTDRRTDEDGFDELPEAIRFETYRGVLEDERAGRLRDEKGKALQDADVFREMLRRLQEDGLLERTPHPGKWTKTLRNFRTRLKRGQLADALTRQNLDYLTSNQRERNRLYAESRPVTNSEDQDE